MTSKMTDVVQSRVIREVFSVKNRSEVFIGTRIFMSLISEPGYDFADVIANSSTQGG